MKSSDKGYSLSLTTKGTFMTFSRCRFKSARLIAFPSYSRKAPPSLATPNSNVDCLANAYCPGIVAKSHGAHEWKQGCPYDKCGSKKSWALLQHLWDQSQKTLQLRLLSMQSSSYKSFWTAFSAEAHHVTLIAACAAGVTQTRSNTWQHLLRLLQPA